MPVKSNFAAGNILTASDTNTYLTNGGLVYITQANVTAGNAFVTFNNCFSSTYENYRIVFRYTQASAGYPAIYFTMRTGTTNFTTNVYNYMGNGRTSANADASYASANSTFGYVGSLTGAMAFDLFSPFNSSAITYVTGMNAFVDAGGSTVRTVGNTVVTTQSFDGIQFSTGTSTFNTGTIYIYGYRNA